MKMKEVCARTGLTERTVRFYVEEELINPQMSVVNGREYRDYSEQDVAELATIADLRKLFFSIEEIKRMKEKPAEIADVLEAYRGTVASDVRAKSAILEALDRLDPTRIDGIGALAGSLKTISASLPLPKRDVTPPNFGRFDDVTKEEREREYERYLKRQGRRFATGRIIVYAIAGLNVLGALISSFLKFDPITLIIQIALSIALVAGVSWIRYLFAAGAALNVLIAFLGLIWVSGEEGMSVGLALFLAFQIAYSLASCFLLLRSQAVSDFLYAQKNG